MAGRVRKSRHRKKNGAKQIGNLQKNIDIGKNTKTETPKIGFWLYCTVSSSMKRCRFLALFDGFWVHSTVFWLYWTVSCSMKKSRFLAPFNGFWLHSTVFWLFSMVFRSIFQKKVLVSGSTRRFFCFIRRFLARFNGFFSELIGGVRPNKKLAIVLP